MHLLTTAPRAAILEVTAPSRFGVVDLSARVEEAVVSSGVADGIAVIFCRHTTCGVLINELEDGLVEDLARHLEQLVDDGYFAHDDLARRTQNLQGPNEPANGGAHIRQILFGASSQAIPIVAGRMALGTWQRILFLELDEPRPRSVVVTIVGT